MARAAVSAVSCVWRPSCVLGNIVASVLAPVLAKADGFSTTSHSRVTQDNVTIIKGADNFAPCQLRLQMSRKFGQMAHHRAQVCPPVLIGRLGANPLSMSAITVLPGMRPR
jgi:uncharacterized membrane protein